jgi:heptosyltransferase II
VQIGIFLPNWIGDTAMATPALRALRTHFGPQAHLTGVLRPYLADVLAGTRWLDEQVFFNPRGVDRSVRSWPVAKALRARQFDLVVLLTNSLRTGLMAWASGAPLRVGYARYGRGLTLTTRLEPPREGRRLIPTSAIDAYLKIAYELGCPTESRRLELATLPDDEAAADAVWKKLRLPPGDQVVVLNSGGAFGAAKHWPAEHFAGLAKRIADRDKLAVLVNCGPNERDIAADIVGRANHPGVVSLADEPRLPVGLTKACIRRSRLLVSTDSGPRFFAVAFGVPVVSLFGPTHPAWSRTYYAREICLQHDVPCGPCMLRTCPHGHHQCMRDLDVDTVHRAVLRQLEAGRGVAA